MLKYSDIKGIKTSLVVGFGAAMLLLVTLANGQPFFFEDTPSYVREPDAAVVRGFGSRFATSWTYASVARLLSPDSVDSKAPDSSPTADVASTTSRSVGPSVRAQHTNALESGVILSGRSAYYGALLYLGEITGGFWLSVIAQALIVSYVVYVLCVRCLDLPVNAFIIVISVLASVSTVPFFVGFLMPYIFAAVAILVTGIFIAFWTALRTFERVVLALILIFSLLSHLTHLLTCILILAIYVASSTLQSVRAHYFRWAPAITIAACVMAGAAGEIAFNMIVSKVMGVKPIRPPLVMARLINLGPGLQYLKVHCNDGRFVICQFQQRLPLDTDNFIWNHDPAVGVFAPASPEIKRALGDEQFAFALKVFEFDPAGVLYNSLRAGVNQLATFSLDEFRNKDDQWNQFSSVLPTKYWDRMQDTLAFRYGLIVDMISNVDYAVVVLSCLFLILAQSMPLYQKLDQRSEDRIGEFSSSKTLLLVVVCGGLIFNALICAALSTVHSHYQARVVWLVPLVAILFFLDFSWQGKREIKKPSDQIACANRELPSRAS